MQLFTYLYQFSQKRLSWFFLILFIIFFESCALFFQHVLLLSPCVMCIYERVAMMGIAGSALIGLIYPKNHILRLIGLAGWGYTSYTGWQLAMEHVGYQTNTSIFATCDLFPQFPSWAPLDKWAPWIFEPSGDCAEVVWQFLTLSMPQWLVIIFACSLIVWAFIVLSQIMALFRHKNSVI